MSLDRIPSIVADLPGAVAESSVAGASIAVVIPCFKVSRHIVPLLRQIGSVVSHIIVVDDCCPEGTATIVERDIHDSRVIVLRHAANQGVGGAMVTGYRHAIGLGADVIVKLDGDGQMDPGLIPTFVAPLLGGEADYTKGNRFFDLESMRGMPLVRLIGNIGLSFLTKLSSGYWNLFDPTNGYTAIHASVAAQLPLDKIAKRYFFESDMLFRLNTLSAVVFDIPMQSVYRGEVSNMNIVQEFPRFILNNAKNFMKRIFFNYVLRNFNIASIQLFVGLPLFCVGVFWGASAWIDHMHRNVNASAGTVMLPSLCVIIGFQMLLGFMNYDTSNLPRDPLHRRLIGARRLLPPVSN